MSQPTVEVCVVNRDGRFDRDVMCLAESACRAAAAAGIDCELAVACDQYGVAPCRNRGVAGFLSRGRDLLLFVDDDVTLPADAIPRLLALAARHPGDAASGCVPSVRTDARGTTAAYVQVRQPNGAWLTDWPTGEVEADMVGGGCLLLPRGVFEVVGFPWFRWPERLTPEGVRAQSDDADFCTRLRQAGRRVWATGDVRCGHKKVVDVALLIGRG